MSIRRLMNNTFSHKLIAPAYRIRMENVLQRIDAGPGNSVLEVGCGRGEYSGIVSALGAEVFSVDISRDDVIHSARRHNGKRNHFVIADAQSLPFRDGSFSCAFSTEVLEHVEDDSRAVSEISRTVSEGSLVIIEVPHATAFRDPLNAAMKMLHMNPIRSLSDYAWKHERMYTRKHAVDTIRQSGLKVEESAYIVNPFVLVLHMYLPELLTFHILPKVSRSGEGRPGPPSVQKKYMFRALYRISDMIIRIDGAIGGSSHGGIIIKARKPKK